MNRAPSLVRTLALLACASLVQCVPPAAPAGPDVTIRMDFGPTGGFYRSPFPDESRRRSDGTIDLSGFPNPKKLSIVSSVVSTIEKDARGFGLTSGIFFALDGKVDPRRLPSIHDSVTPASPVFLIGVDAGASDHLVRYPIDCDFQEDGGPHGTANLLTLLPLQGSPLREGTLYAAVVLRDLRDAAGKPLGVPAAMRDLERGVQPAGMSAAAFAEHRRALAALRTAGVDVSKVAGLAVFRTDHPTRQFELVAKAAAARPLPAFAPPKLVEVHAEYGVYRTTVKMPVYQGGTPPFVAGGGDWRFDAQGRPVLQVEEEANLFVTVPRTAMPAGGFPAVVFVRTGAGQDEKPLVDRGTHPAAHTLSPPGTGPAREFARAGFLAVQVDGPHGGRRNVSGLDEQLLIFNFVNPVAMRDNVRQSALELVLAGEMLKTLSFDARDCPGLVTPGNGPVTVDANRVALFGHSMGATIAPLVLATQPLYRAGVLSGAGASWLQNLVHKGKPVPTRAMAEVLFGYLSFGRYLHEHDPILSMVQWAGEPADPAVYARLVTREPRLGDPRHVLMFQGIADHYIPPPIANALSLSLGVDLAGPALDLHHPDFAAFDPFASLADLAGATSIGLPASANRTGPAGPATAVLVQVKEDGLEDGHEIVFQTERAKRIYRRFLSTFAQGVPVAGE